MAENEHVIHLTDVDFEKEVIASTTPVLVDFWAPWCAPCRTLGPILEELAEEYGERLKIGKLNVDEGERWARAFGIQQIPTLVLFKEGSAQARVVGAAPRALLEAFLDKALRSWKPAWAAV